MGNRSYLYITSPHGEDHEQIAEANNNFPTLWKLLLAHGNAAPAIDDQRVFGDAGTSDLAADAPDALHRVRQLAAFMLEHPQLEKLPLITLQFDALDRHLSELAERWGSDAGPARLSASLDELSWLSGDDAPGAFINTCREECNELWARVSAAIQARHYPALDEALGLLAHGSGGFADWPAWAWGFGFTGLNHPYFERATEPRSEPFADFVPPEGDDHRLYLGNGWRIVEETGRWGVVHEDEDGARRTVLAPEWDDVFDTTAEGLVWVERDGLVGLARLGEAQAELILGPAEAQLEEVWNFEDGVAVVQRGGLQGFLREDGSWLMEPMADELWLLENGYASFRIGERQGVVDANGQVCVEARFDSVRTFSEAGLAVAVEAGHHGLLRPDGRWALPPEYKLIHRVEDLGGYELVQAGRLGLCGEDGSPRLAVEWDEFKPLVPLRLLAARRDKLWAVFDWQGTPRIEPRFNEVEFRYTYDLPATEDGASQLDGFDIDLLVRVGKRTGIVNAHGDVRVPLDYSDIFSFPGMPQLSAPADPFVGLVRRGKANRRSSGVFDTRLGREIVECTWDHLARVPLDEQEFVFLVSSKPPKGERHVGLLKADGAVLFPAEYAWLAAAHDPTDSWGEAIVSHRLREQWQAGEPIQAVHAASDRYVWLRRDGSVEDHASCLARRFAAGDVEAAVTLGRHLRDGEGIDRDAAQARVWLARAAGVAEPRAAAAAPEDGGLLRRLSRWLSGNATQALPEGWTPGPAVGEGTTIGHCGAMLSLAEMLLDGQGGPEQPQEARAWLEHAITRENDGQRDLLFRLAYVLDCGIGGERDIARAHALYEKAAALDHPTAWHNLGLIHQYGDGVAADPVRALECFRQAERLGDHSSAYHVGALLRSEALALEGKARRKRLSEAAYFLRKVTDDPQMDHHAHACGELGQIHLDPQTAEHDLDRAEALLRSGAEQNLLECMDLLERLYADTSHRLHNPAEAARWAALAAEARAQA